MSEIRKRVLIIGAGQRVRNNFIPALRCLSDQFEIVGVHARRAEPLKALCSTWGVKPVFSLQEVDFDQVDVVAISIPISENSGVLRSLLPHAAKTVIVIDTPVATSLTELNSINSLLPQFKQVVVTEDYMNFPSFSLIRKAVKSGLIGDVKAIVLTNIGFLYHGLALIRSFLELERASRATAIKVGNSVIIVRYWFPGGAEACVVGPYRRLEGTITVEGAKALITDSSYDRSNMRGYLYRLRSTRDERGHIARFEIVDTATEEPTGYSVDLPHLAEMAALPFEDKSDLNLLRGCGLMAVFQSLVSEDPLNEAYGPENALYDSFISHAASERSLPLNLSRWIKADMMLIVKLAARARKLMKRR